MTTPNRRQATDPRGNRAPSEKRKESKRGGRRQGSGRRCDWRSGPGVAIRVPEAMAAELLAIARDMDSGKPVFTGTSSNDRAVAEAVATLRAELERVTIDRKATLNRSRIKSSLATLEHYQAGDTP
jgi:hypothetical protein